MLIPALFTLLTLTGGKAAAYPHLASAVRTDRVLIVAPHIDDEAIGAGGFASDALANGAEVYVVFLTAGDCNRFSARVMHRTLDPSASNYLSVGRRRIGEAKLAMSVLGIPSDHFFVLGYPDRGLRAILDNPLAVVRSRGTHQHVVPYDEAMSPGSPYMLEHLLDDLERVIEVARPTMVISPVPFDTHPDHIAAAEITNLALDELNVSPIRLGYLVHMSRLRKPLVWMPRRALMPPRRMRGYTWATYPLTPKLQQLKDAILRTYLSQRPWLYLLRNAFVRRNELFFLFGP
jgi:LmbE family N-acetylglucosaminyl deacetylase